MKEYFDTFGLDDIEDKPRRNEWEILGFHVTYVYYPSPTGSSSDSMEQYNVYQGRSNGNGSGVEWLFSLDDVKFEDLERLILEKLNKTIEYSKKQVTYYSKQFKLYKSLLKRVEENEVFEF